MRRFSHRRTVTIPLNYLFFHLTPTDIATFSFCVYISRAAFLRETQLYRQPPVNGKHLTGDKFCRIAGQEKHGVGNVLGQAQPLQGNFFLDFF